MADRTALLIIDLFSLFDFPQAEQLEPLAVEAARGAARLRRAFDNKKLPVIYANDNFGEWQRDFPQLVRDCRRHGGASAEIARYIGPQAGHYFVLKPKHSAFLATPLPVLLAKLKVNRVVLCGMTLESCILATAIDANSREYGVVVALEAVASLPGRREAAQITLDASDIAQLQTVENIIGDL